MVDMKQNLKWFEVFPTNRRGAENSLELSNFLRTSGLNGFISLCLQPGDCAYDIGANAGHITRILCEAVAGRPGGCVYAFEAHPKLAAQLAFKIGADRSMANARVVAKAVSSEIGPKVFYIDTRPNLNGVASSVNVLSDLHQAGMVETVNVPGTTIDTFVSEGHPVPKFIKIDVEGHEWSVIQGGAKTILDNKPFIVFEFWETWWEKGVRNIFSRLNEHYFFYRLQDGKNITIDYYDHATLSGTVDICCVPKQLM